MDSLIAGVVLALSLLLAAFWVGADWIGAKRYQDGFAAGQLDERAKADERMETVKAKLQSEGLALQQKESAIARERNRIQDAAREAARVQLAEDAGAASLELQRVLERMRVAEAAARSAIRRANRPDGVPSPAGAASGSDAAARGWTLPEGDGGDLARLASEADILAAQYRACYNAFPKPVRKP